MDADTLRAILAIGCIAGAALDLAQLVRGQASWVTAIDLAIAAAIWSVLVGAPIWAPIAGAALALAFLVVHLADAEAGIEELQW